MHIFQLNVYFWHFSALLRVLVSWLFDGSEPGFNCHELVPFVFNFVELAWCFHFLLLYQCFIGNIDISIEIFQSIFIIITTFRH